MQIKLTAKRASFLILSICCVIEIRCNPKMDRIFFVIIRFTLLCFLSFEFLIFRPETEIVLCFYETSCFPRKSQYRFLIGSRKSMVGRNRQCAVFINVTPTSIVWGIRLLCTVHYCLIADCRLGFVVKMSN